MAFAQRLALLRGERRLTQREVAALAGIGMATMNRLEAGHETPQLGTLGKLAAALGVAIEDLIDANELAEAKRRKGAAIRAGKADTA